MNPINIPDYRKEENERKQSKGGSHSEENLSLVRGSS